MVDVLHLHHLRAKRYEHGQCALNMHERTYALQHVERTLVSLFRSNVASEGNTCFHVYFIDGRSLQLWTIILQLRCESE